MQRDFYGLKASHGEHHLGMVLGGQANSAELPKVEQALSLATGLGSEASIPLKIKIGDSH
jgi:hypothetical protein